MTKERLERFNSLRNEIRSLEAMIAETPKYEFVWDTVRASDDVTGKVRPIVVSGYVESVAKKRLQARLARLEKVIFIELDAVMDYIDTLDNARDRQILTLRYVDGFSVKETAQKTGYKEKYLSTLLSEHLAKMDTDQAVPADQCRGDANDQRTS